MIGGRLGSITYYRNEGGLAFGEGNDSFAGISSGFETRTPSLIVADLNGDGNEELVITDITGELKILTGDISPNFEPENTITELADHALLQGLQTTRLGAFSPLAAADLFGDGRPALVFGNPRGGLSLYRNLSTRDGGPSADIRLFAFPNPSTGTLFLQSSSNGSLNIYTITGHRIQQDVPISSTEQLEVNTAEMPAGIYLFRVTNGTESSVVKVIVQR